MIEARRIIKRRRKKVTCGPDVSHFCLTVVVPMAAHDKGGEFYLDQVPFIDIDRGLAPFSAPRIAFNNERHVRLNEEGENFFFLREI